MKKILITGAGSFVGTSVQQHLEQWPEKYKVTAVGTKNGEWKELDFSQFDVVYHVAGLAHSDVGKVTEETKKKYYAVNCDLAIDVAKKAKAEGVKQFIFMSSAIVYGDSAPIGKEKMIGRKTPYSPANFYGDSKVQAEKGLLPLQDERFKVAILRCPMIYGKGSKGNFPILEKMAQKMSLFPRIENKRSMLFVGNLAEFVRLMIVNEEEGIFWPCNREWSSTSELVRMIAECHGKNVRLVSGFEWVLKGLSHFTRYVNKAFGNLAYEEHLGDYKEDYRLFSLEQSIKETEG
ncbi:MAG: NAD-dependent epimerase/dehydratase family protein [Oribacterium sp.]|nr:NAD-dependent epimerase/dehydratase family protein [Lachnospiraceae bacterium]MBP3805450.1 NAD-dependent epimerase/dehydratase family protein [Oribacterium sp.]